MIRAGLRTSSLGRFLAFASLCAFPSLASASVSAHAIAVTVATDTPATIGILELGMDGYDSGADYSHTGFGVYTDESGTFVTSTSGGYVSPLGAGLTLNDDGTLTYAPSASTTPGTVDALWYSFVDVSDGDNPIFGNIAPLDITVGTEATSTPDTTAPVIEVLGDNPFTLTIGDEFTDPGFAATDDVGVVATSTDGSVDTATADTYLLTYYASDLAGNEASSTRTVIVEAAPEDDAPEDSGGGAHHSHRAATTRATLPVTEVLGIEGYHFTRELDYGATGPDVAALQAYLASLGYLDSAPTGFFGFLTKDAVIRYQAAHAIQGSGHIGPQTLTLMNGEAGPMTVIDAADVAAAVAAISAQLADYRARTE